MLADMRDALRQLRKAPGFALTAIITLALGIGFATAIFTLVHQVMLKSLPVVKPEELWRIGDKIRCCNWGGYVQGSDGNFAHSWVTCSNSRAHTPEFSRPGGSAGGQCAPWACGRAGSQSPADTRNGAVRLRQFLPHSWQESLASGPYDDPWLTISRAPPSGGGDELSQLEGAAHRRSHRGWCRLSDQRASLHRDWRGASRLLWRAARRRQHARLLASFDFGTHHRWRDRTPQTARWMFSRPAGPCAAGSNSHPAGSQTQSGISRLAASHVPDMQPGKKQLWNKTRCTWRRAMPGSRRCAISIRTG